MKMEKSLAKNSLFSIIYNISNILFPLITSAYVSRILQADGVGAVAYGQNIVSYFSALAALGLPTYGVREIAKSRTSKDQTNKTFSELLLINTLATGIAVILYVVTVLSIQRFRNNWLLFTVCGIQLILNFFNIEWLFQGCEDYAYIAIRNIIVKFASLLLVLLFVKNSNDYIRYALLSSVALSANYLSNIKRFPQYASLTYSNLNVRRHIKPLIILAVSIFLSTAYSRIDVTMLGAYCNNRTIGLYTNAHRMVEMTTVISISISAVFLPRLSYYYNNDRKAFDDLVNKGVGIVCLLSFPLYIGLVILAPQLMQMLFGYEFMKGALTVRFFSPLVLVKSFGNLLCYQLVIATENENKRLPAYIVGALTNIAFNAILIPTFYQNGAAIASVISETAVNGIQLLAMRKIVKIVFPQREIMQGLLSSLIMGAVVILISKQGESYLLTILCICIGAAVYGALNVLMHNTMTEYIIGLCKSKIGRR